MNWIPINHPYNPAPEGKKLLTKIKDASGERMEQTLVKQGNLWWTPDMKMYVYYTPTHYLLTSS